MQHSSGLISTNFNFPNQSSFYKGKVRDVYGVNDLLVIVASDRISAFDHILPRTIPFKGQVLNQLSAKFLSETRNIVPNWYIDSPDPNVTVGYKCEPIMLEMVIRGYLAGHAWREYKSGKRNICGEIMPDGLNESDRFPKPIITPATKSKEGHDEDISKKEILDKGIVTKAIYEKLEEYTFQLFEYGTKRAADQDLILVDTKYEFGMYNDQIMLIDEIHTPDSSRYFHANEYQYRQQTGVKQKQLSKEFVREWLIEHNFQGKEGQRIPDMSDEIVEEISDKYIMLYESITGEDFVKRDYGNIREDIVRNVNNYMKIL